MDALKSVLSGDALQQVEDAGLLDYIAGVLDGADDPEDKDGEVSEAVCPLLVEAGAAASDEEAIELCTTLMRVLFGSEEKAATVAKSSEPLRALSTGPVSMTQLVKSDEAQIEKEVTAGLTFRVNTNADFGSKANAPIDLSESEAEMKRRFKQAKRGDKLLKRAARREHLLTMQREEFMRDLTREPVVLHWRGGGGGSKDILLKDVSMDINGLLLLEDCSATLVHGRKYGLIGRNGIGKTTFLKYLSAKRFTGVPEQLQILHIEQEVPSGDKSIIETVLATDIERTALLAEEKELLAEAEEEDEKDDEDEADRMERLNEVLERLIEIDSATAPSRASAILKGLGFSDEMQVGGSGAAAGGSSGRGERRVQRSLAGAAAHGESLW